MILRIYLHYINISIEQGTRQQQSVQQYDCNLDAYVDLLFFDGDISALTFLKTRINIRLATTRVCLILVSTQQYVYLPGIIIEYHTANTGTPYFCIFKISYRSRYGDMSASTSLSQTLSRRRSRPQESLSNCCFVSSMYKPSNAIPLQLP